MATKNFSSIGGFGVGSTEVLNPNLELKNISAIHMVADDFTDATNDLFISKRTTDPANNLLRLSFDGSTNTSTNTPPLGHNSVAFVKAKVFGQEVNNNIYVLASAFDAVIPVDTNGVPTLQANFENVIHEHLPGVETWTVTPVAFQIGSNAFFSFDVEAVSTTSTVKWIGIIDITKVSTD